MSTVAHGVAILRKREGSDAGTYSLYCLRCNKDVFGARTGTWVSKTGAVKVAKEHLARHRIGDTWLDRIGGHYEHVGTVSE